MPTIEEMEKIIDDQEHPELKYLIMPEYISARAEENRQEGKSLGELSHRPCDGYCYENEGKVCKFCKEQADQAANNRCIDQGY